MPRKLFPRIRPADLDRELVALHALRAGLPATNRLERIALDRLIRGHERLRRRFCAGLPACRVT